MEGIRFARNLCDLLIKFSLNIEAGDNRCDDIFDTATVMKLGAGE